jgi:hypothetical protein
MMGNFVKVISGMAASLLFIVVSCGDFEYEEQPLPALDDLNGKWVCENNADIYFIFTSVSSGYLNIRNVSDQLMSEFKEGEFEFTYSHVIGDDESRMFYLIWITSPYSGYTPNREYFFTLSYYDFENPRLTLYWKSDFEYFNKRKFLNGEPRG